MTGDGDRPVRLAIVDYGAGNLVSIEQALRRVGADPIRIDRGRGIDPDAVDGLVVPGVGAAGPAMERLAAHDLVAPILDWVAAGRPYVGVCLGLQLLFEGSDEDGAETFGVLAGRTRRLVDAPTLPHIGWNQVERTSDHPLFDGIEPAADFYFVHSFAGVPAAGPTSDSVVATTTHGTRFVSAIARGAVLGVQFHPERSGDDGLRLLANAVGLIGAGRRADAAPVSA